MVRFLKRCLRNKGRQNMAFRDEKSSELQPLSEAEGAKEILIGPSRLAERFNEQRGS